MRRTQHLWSDSWNSPRSGIFHKDIRSNTKEIDRPSNYLLTQTWGNSIISTSSSKDSTNKRNDSTSGIICPFVAFTANLRRKYDANPSLGQAFSRRRPSQRTSSTLRLLLSAALLRHLGRRSWKLTFKLPLPRQLEDIQIQRDYTNKWSLCEPACQSDRPCIYECMSAGCNHLVFSRKDKRAPTELGEIDTRESSFKQCVLSELEAVHKSMSMRGPQNGAFSNTSPGKPGHIFACIFTSWGAALVAIILTLISAVACFPDNYYA
ncbi:hypothetical protein PROFUN_04614 [Planoprotostelium fungivorum]|uniref:Uncharacterized protein n=1 Tax=Planoprotostelium fungivorum TaxID=1890364 RepID=A0A2P6NUD5_9EUKA|nr:hypothetical protein PROFUN_04614 [Planoprotostelium fungivorum]